MPAPATGAGTPVDLSSVAASDDQYVDSAPTSDEPFQRYDVRVSKVRGAKTVSLSWEGKVAADRVAVLSVWNVETQEWTEVASARGTDGADTTLVGRTRLGPTIDGDVVHLLVEARDPFDEVPSTPDEAFENPDDYSFSIAWITDTQYLSQGGAAGEARYGDAYAAMTQWVADNAADRKIVYSAHTGDVINNWQVTGRNEPLARSEYVFASGKMATLDAAVPNGVTPGNHDNKTGSNNDLFNEFFPPDAFDAAEAVVSTGEDGEGYYGGPWQTGDNHNHYDLVEAGGVKLLFLYLGYGVKPEEVAWANQVLAEHRDRKAVVLTHSYLEPSNAPDGRGGELTSDDGQTIFDDVVLPNPNVFLTLSGHTHGVGLNIKRDVGAKGHVVVEMLANQQFYELLDDGERRVGHLRLLQVDLTRGRIVSGRLLPATTTSTRMNSTPGRAGLPRWPTSSSSRSTCPAGRPRCARTRSGWRCIQHGDRHVDGESGGEAAIHWSGLAAQQVRLVREGDRPAGLHLAESSVFAFTTGSGS